MYFPGYLRIWVTEDMHFRIFFLNTALPLVRICSSTQHSRRTRRAGVGKPLSELVQWLMTLFMVATGLTVGCMSVCMVICALIAASVLRIGRSFTSVGAESAFMEECFQFIENYEVGWFSWLRCPSWRSVSNSSKTARSLDPNAGFRDR